MRFIDFFSGIGGFRLGLEREGHKCVGHCEIDKFADASYRMMHILTDEERNYIASLPKKERISEVRKEKYLHGEWYSNDVRSTRPEDLPDAEMYCFGFPCQSFSISGRRRGFEDTRGTLFFEIMRLAKERQPEILFAENVRGLLSHDKGRTFETILRAMDEVGYDAEWQVLDSQYHGVPQHRERIYIIGHLRGRSTRKIFPIIEGNGLDKKDQKQVCLTLTAKYGSQGIVGTYIATDRPTDRPTALINVMRRSM